MEGQFAILWNVVSIADVGPDRLVRKFDVRLQNAAGESRERLLRGIGMDSFRCSCLPRSSDAARALKSPLRVRKILVEKVCSEARHDSPGNVERSELIDCGATMGMHLA